MAITNQLFANGVIYKNAYNELMEGQLLFNDDNEYIQRVTSIVPFSCNSTGPDRYDELVLFEYSDGKKIKMKYKLYTENPNLFHLVHSYSLVDANDNIVNIDSSVAHLNPTTEYIDTFMWEPSPEYGFVTFPFSECYYVPSETNYFVQGQETIANDPAQTIWPCGKVFFKKPVVPLTGYEGITGDHKLGDINGSYAYRYVNICAVSDDAQYAAYFGSVDPDDEWHYSGELPPSPEPSEPGGGDRPSDDGGDAVDFPSLPATSVINTGLISLFNPDNTQLRSLAGVLWSNDFENSIKKILNDPFDGLISLSMVPFTPTTAGSISCEIGNFDTEISMPLINTQYYTLDCGSLQIKENWGNALDYNATSAEIFLPFVGFRPLDIQDVMGRTIALKYMVDILTGAAIAIVKCGDKCLYEYPCNVSYQIPLTGSNRAALYTGLINVAMSGLGGLARGGAMGAIGGAATSALNVATSAQSNVQRSGSLASNTGILGEFTPYVVLHRPKQSMAQNFKSFKGYQANITMKLGACKGYTEVDYIHLTNISGATDTELNEIEALLKKGVII